MVRIRSARLEDADAIAGIRVRGWQTAYRGQLPDAFLDGLIVEPDRWRSYLAEPAPGRHALVAETDGVVNGFVTFGPSRDQDAPGGEIYAVYVDPPRYGRGIGTELMAAAESQLSADGHDNAVLWTLTSNERTRRFYERLGWRTDGTTKTDARLGVALEETRYRRTLADNQTEAPSHRRSAGRKV